MTPQRPRTVLAVATAATGLLIGGLAAEAAPASTDSTSKSALFGRAAKVTTEFRFTFDRRESLRPGTTARDVSGHRNHGTVRTSNGDTFGKSTECPANLRSFRASAVAAP